MEEIPILGVIALRGGGNSYSRPRPRPRLRPRPRNFSFTARFVCYSGHRNRTAPFHANNTSELWLHLLWHRVLKLSRNLDRWSHAGLNRGPYGLAVRSNRLSYETHGRNPEGAGHLRVALQLAALEIAQAKPGSCHAQEAAAQCQLNRINLCRFFEESTHVGIPSLMSTSQQNTNSVGACENASTPGGFEPLRAEHNAFRVHLLSRSDTVSLVRSRI